MPAGGTEAGTRPAELDIQRWTSGGPTRRSAGSQAGTGGGPRGLYEALQPLAGVPWVPGQKLERWGHEPPSGWTAAAGHRHGRGQDEQLGPVARLPAGDTVPSPWADVTLPQTGPGEGTETPGSDRGLRAELELPTLVPTLILPPSALHPGDAQPPRAERGARLTWVLGLGQRVVQGVGVQPPPQSRSSPAQPICTPRPHPTPRVENGADLVSEANGGGHMREDRAPSLRARRGRGGSGKLFDLHRPLLRDKVILGGRLILGVTMGIK